MIESFHEEQLSAEYSKVREGIIVTIRVGRDLSE